jgi:hypothetical protein
MKRIASAVITLLVGVLAIPAPLFAYHFFHTSNLPVAWRTLPVAFIVDKDPAGFQTTVQNAFNVWNNVTTAKDIFGTITLSADDLTAANYQTPGGWGFLTADGKHEVVCDSDGQALANLGLSATGTLGYGPSRREVVGGQGAITDTFFILNCSIAEGPNFSYLGTMVHELGHNIGLAHSSAYLSHPERLKPLAIGDAPTMYPYAIPNNDAASATLEADDIAGISHLYPESNFSTSYGTITGTVTRCGDDAPVHGVNVRAVSTSNNKVQITRYTGYDGNAAGSYEIKVPPGSYNIIIEVMSLPINAMAMLTGVDKDFATEYRSNPTEEEECSEEIPDDPVSISVGAGDMDGESAVIGAGITANQNFKTNPVEIAFVVDDTGSMGPEIGAVRQTLTNEIARLQAETSKPFPNTAIVTFKDSVTIRKISRDPAVLQATVNALTASSGGDCPEWSNDALLAAGRLLRKGGVAMLFTDADSHPNGATAGAVSSFYNSKSLRMSVLLSGTCSGDLDRASDQRGASGMDPAKSQNPDADASEAVLDRLPPEPKLGFQSSIETNAAIAAATGGMFAAIPGIKDSDPVETQRYINTGTNIAVSATLPTVGLVTPGDGPRGTTIDVDIYGSNTNFQGASVLSFSGTGVTVVSRAVRSATLISARISIDASAATGFRDVTVTTSLGGGTIETATGVGAFNIVTAPTGPTIISVSPSSAGRGRTLDVTISALNTNFTSSSVVLFCDFYYCDSTGDADPKITVNSVTALNATTILANITIAADAAIAYRSVTVLTGAQTAQESVVGPFLVTPPALAIPTLTSVTPSSGTRGETLNVSVLGENTNFVNGTSVLSFSGSGITVNTTIVSSPTAASANITIAAGAALGFRDVLMTTAGETAASLNGFNVADGVPTAQPPLGLYAASIVGNEVTLRWTAPAGGLVPTGYVLEGGLNPGEVLASIPTGSTNPVFTVTAPTGAFYVRVYTLAGINRSAASNEIRIYVNMPVAPSTPTNFTGMVNGSSVSFGWQNTFAGGTPASLILDVTGSATASLPIPFGESVTFPGAPSGTYTFRLRASNASGASSQSNAVTLTVPGACTGVPQAPTDFLAYRESNTIYVMWNPPAGGAAATSYTLVVTGAFNLNVPTTGRSMFGTVPAGTYNLSVRGNNGCGAGTSTAVQMIVVP